MLSLKPWGAAARYVTPEVMVSHLSQVARYLARKEPDAHGTSLDGRIRARVAEAVGTGRPWWWPIRRGRSSRWRACTTSPRPYRCS
ncbi:hypothetical protein ACFWG6_22090 [Streptomyces erythrochromogenes]|uniref:hypothetical protein n=1 Tax=Streptomyces erythrochromogenes TaxID=285574 RepID=UPI003636E562